MKRKTYKAMLYVPGREPIVQAKAASLEELAAALKSGEARSPYWHTAGGHDPKSWGLLIPSVQLTTFGKAEQNALRGRDRRRWKRLVGLQVKQWQRWNARSDAQRTSEDGTVQHRLDTSYGGRMWLLRTMLRRAELAWGERCSRAEFNKTRKL